MNGALRLVYSNTSSTYDELLEKDKSFKIHQRNLQKLAVEIFKIKSNIAPPILMIYSKTNHSAIVII